VYIIHYKCAHGINGHDDDDDDPHVDRGPDFIFAIEVTQGPLPCAHYTLHAVIRTRNNHQGHVAFSVAALKIKIQPKWPHLVRLLPILPALVSPVVKQHLRAVGG
jgi:hypothetical protein